MKRLICIAMSLWAMLGFSAGAQQVEKENAELIVAVNTDWGVGYFTDAEGRLLFKKQFEAVEPFFEGLAAVKKDGLYGYINTKGEMVIPCVLERT